MPTRKSKLPEISGDDRKPIKVTAIVLAGGKYLRLGKNKALEVIGGTSLIERVIERLQPFASQILIVTSPELVTFPVSEKAKALIDLYPDKGPLAGIYTGLQAARTSYSLVVACDMPFLNQRLLGYMIGLAPGFDAVVPRLGERMMEPLHAVYARSCRDKMKARLENDQLSLNSFLGTVKVRYVERDECQRFDPQLLSFFNINYPADLDKAITLAVQEKK
ncbi:MAG: molybdenum cofactor guanylyltransferase [Chloroflexota bacterium]